jgi:hypothetical protein
MARAGILIRRRCRLSLLAILAMAGIGALRGEFNMEYDSRCDYGPSIPRY